MKTLRIIAFIALAFTTIAYAYNFGEPTLSELKTEIEELRTQVFGSSPYDQPSIYSPSIQERLNQLENDVESNTRRLDLNDIY